MLQRIVFSSFALLAVATLFAQSSHADAPTTDYILTKPLPTRAKISDAAGDNLLPPSRVRILMATDSKMLPTKPFTPGAWCHALILSEKLRFTFLPCDNAGAFKAAPQFEYKNDFGEASYPRNHDEKSPKGKAFCDSVCVNDKGTDGKITTRCSGMPTTNSGWIPPDSSDLKKLAAGKHISLRKDNCSGGKCELIHTACSSDADCYPRATQMVVNGLDSVDKLLDGDPRFAGKGFSMVVSNCWRDGYEESKIECYKWEHEHEDPSVKGTWPGANPHSKGHGCDLHLYKDGKEYLNCDADRSKLMDELMTAAGAVRFTGEAWHYEWGNSSGGSRCSYPNCPAPKIGCP